MTDTPAPVLTGLNLPEWLSRLHLIEMKTTRATVDRALGGFFFGVTERELDLASRLGDRYLFAFVVLSRASLLEEEFFVLLTAEELHARTQTKRVQYQVDLVRSWNGPTPKFGSGPLSVAALVRTEGVEG